MKARISLTPQRLVHNKESKKNQCWNGCGDKGILIHCWWECILVQSFQKFFHLIYSHLFNSYCLFLGLIWHFYGLFLAIYSWITPGNYREWQRYKILTSWVKKNIFCTIIPAPTLAYLFCLCFWYIKQKCIFYFNWLFQRNVVFRTSWLLLMVYSLTEVLKYHILVASNKEIDLVLINSCSSHN